MTRQWLLLRRRVLRMSLLFAAGATVLAHALMLPSPGWAQGQAQQQPIPEQPGPEQKSPATEGSGQAVEQAAGTTNENPSETKSDGQVEKKKPAPARAWEYDPYRVVVLTISDYGEPIAARMADIHRQIEGQAMLVDSSAWAVTARTAPTQWNWRLQTLLDDPQAARYLTQDQMLKEVDKRKRDEERRKKQADSDGVEFKPNTRPVYSRLTEQFSELIDQFERDRIDKLVVLRIDANDEPIMISAREYDIHTRTWGAKNVLPVRHSARLGAVAYQAVANAFMPLARIEKAFDKQNQETKKQERWARVRVRALGLSRRVELNEEGSRVLVSNDASPVAVRSTDVFKPVVRRLDTERIFKSVDVIDWTYLIIQEEDGPNLECRTISKQRVPLAGKSGSRIEKLGLVIRPPNRPTKLTIIAPRITAADRAAKPNPLSDYEVFSRNFDMAKGEPSEELGRTDYFGEIMIPPSEKGVRILYVKSGYRGLARIPIMPGLYDELTVELPDDEARLHAEGIVRSLSNEVLELTIQRLMLGVRIRRELEGGKLEDAEELMEKFESLDDTDIIKDRVNTERDVLVATGDKLSGRIDSMFSALTGAIEKHIPRSQADDLRTLIQRYRDRPEGETGPIDDDEFENDGLDEEVAEGT